MTRQTILGCVFLLLGLVLVTIAVAPIGYALVAHQPVPPVTMLFLVFLGIGVFVAVFGAWLIPSSGAPAAFTQIVVASGPLLNRVPGLSRVDDPKPASKDGAP